MILKRLQSFSWQFLQPLRSVGLILLTGVSLAFLNACSPTRPADQITDWLVSVKRSGDPRTPISPVWLKVGTISVTTPFDGKSLVYRLTEGRYEKDFYNAYIALPNEVRRKQLAQLFLPHAIASALPWPIIVGRL